MKTASHKIIPENCSINGSGITYPCDNGNSYTSVPGPQRPGGVPTWASVSRCPQGRDNSEVQSPSPASVDVVNGSLSMRAVPHGVILKDAEDTDMARNRGHLVCVPFLATVSLWQMSDFTSLEMGPLWTRKPAAVSKCSFSQPKAHTVLRHVPNVCRHGPLPCCSRALTIQSPAEATAVVQTRWSFRAHSVPSKNSHRSYQFTL